MALKSDRDQIDHQSGVFAQILGESIGRPLYRGGRAVPEPSLLIGTFFTEAHSFSTLLDLANTGQEFVDAVAVLLGIAQTTCQDRSRIAGIAVDSVVSRRLDAGSHPLTLNLS